MSDDLFGSIQRVQNQIESQVNELNEIQQQTPIERLTGGISETPNKTESFRDAGVFNTLLTQDQNFEVVTEFNPTKLNAETSFADLIAGTAKSDPPAAVPQTPSGKVNSDALATIEQELQNDPCDVDNLLAALQNLSPEDQVATLNELGNRGELTAFVSKFQTPEQHQELGAFLIGFQPMANNKDPQAAHMLGQFMHAMDDGQGTYADTVNFMCSWGFPKNSFDEADTMMRILDKDPSQDNRLNNLVLMHELRVDDPAPATGAYRGYMNASDINSLIDQQMNQYINGEVPVPSPGMSALFEKYPQWGEHEIKHLHNFGQLDAFMNQLSQSSEPIAQMLGPMLKDCSADPALSSAFDQILSKLITDKNPNGDDIVRDMVTTLGQYPKDTLSKLPSNLLLEMRLLLQMGDESDLNQPVLSIVNDAMANHA